MLVRCRVFEEAGLAVVVLPASSWPAAATLAADKECASLFTRRQKKASPVPLYRKRDLVITLTPNHAGALHLFFSFVSSVK